MSRAPSPAWVDQTIRILALGLFLFVLYTALVGEFSTDIQRGVPFALIAVIVLLRHPVVAGARWLRLIDLALMAAAVYAVSYVAVHGDLIVRRLGRLHPQDVAASLIGLLVLFEIARRTVGLLLPMIAFLFAAYAAYGALLPGASGMSSASPGRVALAAWVGTDGVFGVAFGVMVGVVYVYVLLAALMERSQGTQALVTVAYFLTRGTRSGPGMTTVASSGLFGMASGSGVADVAAVGTANIPAMRQAGYSAPFAASVQALSSIGAQVMPPIMGSSAFILAELTGTPYAQVALMAIIPALLYYVCVAAAVQVEARRLGLVANAEAPPAMAWGSIILGVSPLLLLVVLLVQGMSPSSAGFYAVMVLLIIGLIRRNRQLSPRQLLSALLEGTLASLPMWTATAVIGVIVASVALTGLTTDISLIVVKLSKDSLFLALMVVMLASIVLGTALPTIAAYLLLVIMVAPALQDLGVPLLIAHFFVFYYGVTSDLTPPTALAPLTAAAMAGADFWQTCWLTMRIGLPIFVLPFAFVYHPELLLMGEWPAIVGAVMSCALGIIAFSAGAGGYLLRPLGVIGRLLLVLAGLALIAPGSATLAAGLAALALVLGFQAFWPGAAARLRI